MAQERWTLDTASSYITYDAEHFLHDWSGTNKNVKGVVVAENNEFQKIAIAMFVRDFDSKNSNRDNNALEILEVLKFPKIEFYSDDISLTDDKMIIAGDMDFHGIGQEKIIKPNVNLQKNKLVLTGAFEMLLSDFKVPLPSFMMKKIEDKIKLSYKLHFTKFD